MKRSTKAILIYIAVCLVLSVAAAIVALYNMPERGNAEIDVIEVIDYSGEL